MYSAVLRTCAAFVILSSAAIFHPSQTLSQKDDPTSTRVWLAVEQHSRAQLLIEPVATVKDSVLTPVQTSCLSDALTSDTFSAKYLQPGRKYPLLFGGAFIGEGQVAEQNRSAATVSLV
jgi:hypothetical protein